MVKKYFVFIHPSWFSKLFYKYHSTFLLSERWKHSQKTVGMFGAFGVCRDYGSLCVGQVGGNNPSWYQIMYTKLLQRIKTLNAKNAIVSSNCMKNAKKLR